MPRCRPGRWIRGGSRCGGDSRGRAGDAGPTAWGTEAGGWGWGLLRAHLYFKPQDLGRGSPHIHRVQHAAKVTFPRSCCPQNLRCRAGQPSRDVGFPPSFPSKANWKSPAGGVGGGGWWGGGMMGREDSPSHPSADKSRGKGKLG